MQSMIPLDACDAIFLRRICERRPIGVLRIELHQAIGMLGF
jgi:hypothetical protein